MRPFLRHDKDEPITPGAVYPLRLELIPMSVLVRKGERLRLEISNTESTITEAPMIHWYGRQGRSRHLSPWRRPPLPSAAA